MKTLLVTLATLSTLCLLCVVMFHALIDREPLTERLGFAPTITVQPLSTSPVRRN